MKDKKLHSIKNSGFKVPKDYFDTLDGRLFHEVKLKSKIDDAGFVAPKNYFNDLENTIVDKISKEDNSKVISIFNKRNLVYISSVAAAVLLLFSLSILKADPITFDSLDTETVENYILEENIGTYEINAALTEDDFYVDNFADVTIDDDSFENYILNDIDIEDIMLE